MALLVRGSLFFGCFLALLFLIVRVVAASAGAYFTHNLIFRDEVIMQWEYIASNLS